MMLDLDELEREYRQDYSRNGLLILKLILAVKDARKRNALDVVAELEYPDYLKWSNEHKHFPQISAGGMEAMRAYLFYLSRLPHTFRNRG